MRKTIFAFLFAIMFSMAIGSCGNGTGTATDVDSTAVDTTVVDSLVDSLVVDSVVADTVAVDTTVAE
jgi:hypothetical protein